MIFTLSGWLVFVVEHRVVEVVATDTYFRNTVPVDRAAVCAAFRAVANAIVAETLTTVVAVVGVVFADHFVASAAMVDAMCQFCAASVFYGVAVVAEGEVAIVAVSHDGVHGALAGVALVAGFCDVVSHNGFSLFGFHQPLLCGRLQYNT